MPHFLKIFLHEVQKYIRIHDRANFVKFSFEEFTISAVIPAKRRYSLWDAGI